MPSKRLGKRIIALILTLSLLLAICPMGMAAENLGEELTGSTSNETDLAISEEKVSNEEALPLLEEISNPETFLPENSSVTVQDSDQNGIDLDKLTPIEPALVFGGDAITNGQGIGGHYIYLTEEDVNDLRNGTKSPSDFNLGSWLDNQLYSAHDEHGTNTSTVYEYVSGLDLSQTAESLGVDQTANTCIYLYADDGYDKVLSNAYKDRYYFAPDGTNSPVPPALAFLKDDISQNKASTSCQTFVYGQDSLSHDNHCSWIHGVNRVGFGNLNGDESAALTVYKTDATKTALSVTDLIQMGIYQTEYAYLSHGTDYVHTVQGIPLSALLTELGLDMKANQTIQPATADNFPVAAINYDEMAKCFVAWSVTRDDGEAITSNTAQLRLYRPGSTGNEVVVKDLVSLTLNGSTQANSAPALAEGIKAEDSASIALNSSGYWLNLDNIFADPDEDSLTYYQIQDNGDLTELEGRNYFLPTTIAGEYSISLKAYDGASYSEDSYKFTLIVFLPGGNKTAYQEGDDLSDSVFFITLQSSSSGEVKYYYYSQAELEAASDVYDFDYSNHSIPTTLYAKGALLSDLIADLDTQVSGDLMIQYLEADGYHAKPNQALNYQDQVSWLTANHTSGTTEYNPMKTVITYGVNTQYTPEVEAAFGVTSDPEGVFEDADGNTGYLRAYRVRPDANSCVLKYLMGVAISPMDSNSGSGILADANTGFTLVGQDTQGQELTFTADVTSTIKGLITGMKYAVKAPKVVGADLLAGEAASQVVTVGSGTSDQVIFKYQENPYFSLQNGTQKTDYVFSDLKKQTQQVPEVQSTDYYGYTAPMFYRYNGMWLSDLVGNLTNTAKIQSVVLVGSKGEKITIKTEDLGKYFVAYSNTQSKGTTNIPEGKRITKNYENAKIIIPSDGTLVALNDSEYQNYEVIGNDATVVLAEAEGLTISYKTSTGGGGGSGGSSGGGGSSSNNSQSATGTSFAVTTIFNAQTTVQENTAQTNLTSEEVTNLLEQAKTDQNQAQKDGHSKTQSCLLIQENAAQNTDLTVSEFSLDQESLKKIQESGAELQFKSQIAELNFDNQALKALLASANGGTLKLKINRLNPSDLNNSLLEANDLVYQFTWQNGTKLLSQFGQGQVAIAIPYTLTNKQKAEDIQVYYLPESGALQKVTSKYTDGNKIFSVDHFSYYLLRNTAAVSPVAPEPELISVPAETPDLSSAPSFVDVAAEAWYWEAVEYVVGQGLFAGTSEQNFSPQSSMTRAMLVTVLYNLAGQPATNTDNSFTDVSNSAWYAKAVAWASSNQIVSGISPTQFAPDSPVTREQAVVILYNYAAYQGYALEAKGELSNFQDQEQIADWARTAFSWAIGQELIAGKSNQMLDPQGLSTRAEVAAILMQFCQSF